MLSVTYRTKPRLLEVGTWLQPTARRADVCSSCSYGTVNVTPLRVFRSLTGAKSRLGFYTKETRDLIPEASGWYAWFVPLWIYCDDFDSFVHTVNGLFDYEQVPKRQVDVSFNWESVRLCLRRGARPAKTDSRIARTWSELILRDDAKHALQQTLLEASLLMPPLYVGRTSNLRYRYLQHIKLRSGDENDFHSRFSAHATSVDLKIGVSDLLYVCIETPAGLRAYFGDSDESDVNKLVERLLMRLCRPPFSIR